MTYYLNRIFLPPFANPLNVDQHGCQCERSVTCPIQLIVNFMRKLKAILVICVLYAWLLLVEIL